MKIKLGKKLITKKNLATIAGVAVIVMLFTTFLLLLFLSRRMNDARRSTVSTNLDEYEKYVCMITSDDEANFWQEVYSVAHEKGDDNGVYVDLLSKSLSGRNSSEDLLRVAIASKPDGIILEVTPGLSMSEMIEEASEANIPIVTVMSDCEATHRISYVSTNNYSLGQLYGSQVMGVAENDSSVLILSRKANNVVGENLIITGIQDTILSTEKYRNISFETATITDEDAFAIEESVRNIFVEEEELPDVIICLDELITTCVYQALIDFNKVGQVQLLGYYDSDTIIEGVKTGVIHSTITVDTVAMGEECIDAFTEYWNSGYVSEFYDVDSSLITQANVDKYLEGNADEN